MWMACYTQDEIAAAVDTPRKTISDVIDSFGEICQSARKRDPLSASKRDPVRCGLFEIIDVSLFG